MLVFNLDRSGFSDLFWVKLGIIDVSML